MPAAAPRVLEQWERLQQLQRKRKSVELLRGCYASAVGAQEPLSVGRLRELLREVAAKCRETDLHRRELERHIRTLDDLIAAAEDPEGSTVDQLPAAEAAAVSVHYLAACDAVIADLSERIGQQSAQLRRLLAEAGLSPEGLLAEQLQAVRGDPAAHTLALCGQPVPPELRSLLLDVLQSCPALQTVSLRGCQLGDGDLQGLLPLLRSLQQLRCLCLQRNCLSAAAVQALRAALAEDRSEAFPNLQVLDVSGNELPAEQAAELQQLVAERYERDRTPKPDAWLHGLAAARRVRVLCLDGGGVRVLGQLECLKRVELITGRPCSALFDLVVGCGAGAVLACAIRLGMPLSTVSDCVRDMADTFVTQEWTLLWLAECTWRSMRSAWTRGDWYSGSALAALLAKHFGDRKMSEANAAVAVVLAQPGRGREFLLRSYDTAASVPHGAAQSDARVADVLRAALAYPGYFSPWQLCGAELADASAAHENPSLLALTELCRSVPPSRITLVSIGSGVHSELGTGDAGEAAERHSLLAQRLAAHAQRAPASAAQVHGHVSAVAAAAGIAYHRINPAACRPMQFDVGAVPWDEASPVVLQSLSAAVADWLQQNPERLERVAADLRS
eukprot:TRINITY_DN12598_c0_g1_i1.p1 TRINITY_DN12598_c0_g1~~TRINITY_DN12598_c0_g1_i1.p1  ORF type:complete len:640 (+),score=259.47 TRINITY_DN12598_c0_g1_i1:70-1920(+)